MGVPATRKGKRGVGRGPCWRGAAAHPAPAEPRHARPAAAARARAARRRRRGAPDRRGAGAGGGVAVHRPVEPRRRVRSGRPRRRVRRPRGREGDADADHAARRRRRRPPGPAPGDAGDAARGAAQRPALQEDRPDPRGRRCGRAGPARVRRRAPHERGARRLVRGPLRRAAEAGAVVGAAVGRPGRARPDGRSVVVRAPPGVPRVTDRPSTARPRAVGAATRVALPRGVRAGERQGHRLVRVALHADGPGRARRPRRPRWSTSRVPAAPRCTTSPTATDPTATRRRRRG